MDAGWVDLLKLWGPLTFGWVIAYLLIRFIMDQYKADIDSRVKLATALESLTKVVERVANGKD